MPTHIKDYRYACHICGRRFTRKFVLDKHIRTHQQDRTFGCEHCSRSFLTLEGLRNHVAIHTGERPYRCGLCPESFMNTSASSVHRRSKHAVDGVYTCGRCGFQVGNFVLFKTHLSTCMPSAIYRPTE